MALLNQQQQRDVGNLIDQFIKDLEFHTNDLKRNCGSIRRKVTAVVTMVMNRNAVRTVTNELIRSPQASAQKVGNKIQELISRGSRVIVLNKRIHLMLASRTRRIRRAALGDTSPDHPQLVPLVTMLDDIKERAFQQINNTTDRCFECFENGLEAWRLFRSVGQSNFIMNANTCDQLVTRLGTMGTVAVLHIARLAQSNFDFVLADYHVRFRHLFCTNERTHLVEYVDRYLRYRHEDSPDEGSESASGGRWSESPIASDWFDAFDTTSEDGNVNSPNETNNVDEGAEQQEINPNENGADGSNNSANNDEEDDLGISNESHFV